jgi:DNA-binding beta-propeller fold protein YncE
LAAEAKAGLQPTGVCASPDGKTAYVVNRAEGTISVLEVTDTSLTERAKIKIAEAGDSLAHVEVSPDGKTALASLNAANAILLLEIGLRDVRIKQRIEAGKGPYGIRFSPDGKTAAVGNTVSDTVTLLSLSGDRAKVMREAPVGRIPEGIDFSPDGTFLAVSCFEGANLTDKSHPKYGQPARIHILKKQADGYQPETSFPVQGGPQFAIFSPDGNYLVVSATAEKKLCFYRCRDGQFLLEDFTLPVDGEPVTACRWSRKKS